MTRQEKKAQSRRRILDAAREIFFRDGFMDANLDEVAASAGVAKGTLYRYFASKAELYVAVLAHNGEIFRQRMRETLSPNLTAADQIRRTGGFYLDHWMKNRDYFRIFWAMENQAVIGELPREVIAEVSKLWEDCVQIVAEIIETGVGSGEFRECNAWEVANILWTLANGVIETETNPARRQLQRQPLERVYEDAIELVLRGLSPTGNPLDTRPGLDDPAPRER